MSTSRETVLLIGNPRPGSRTRAVAEDLAAQLGASAPDVLELGQLTGLTYSDAPAYATSPDESALGRVRSARLLIVATPSYKGTYTGLLKLFLDQLPHGGLAGVVAVPLAVAGSPDHARATADDLARLLRELGADVPAAAAVLEAQLARPDLAATVAAVRNVARSNASA